MPGVTPKSGFDVVTVPRLPSGNTSLYEGMRLELTQPEFDALSAAVLAELDVTSAQLGTAPSEGVIFYWINADGDAVPVSATNPLPSGGEGGGTVALDAATLSALETIGLDATTLAALETTELGAATLTALESVDLNSATLAALETIELGAATLAALETIQAIPPTSTATTVIQSFNSTSSGQLLASSASRKGASFYNDSASTTIILKLGTGSASATSFTVKVAPKSYYEIPFGYTGAIQGFADATEGSTLITDYS